MIVHTMWVSLSDTGTGAAEEEESDKLGCCHALSTLKLIISHNEGIESSN